MDIWLKSSSSVVEPLRVVTNSLFLPYFSPHSPGLWFRGKLYTHDSKPMSLPPACSLNYRLVYSAHNLLPPQSPSTSYLRSTLKSMWLNRNADSTCSLKDVPWPQSSSSLERHMLWLDFVLIYHLFLAPTRYKSMRTGVWLIVSLLHIHNCSWYTARRS